MPPTERRGRVHTSTVTVAVLDPSIITTSIYTQCADSDFRVEWTNGTIGAGGQHHQKNETCCRLTHIPTGMRETRQGRSRQANLRDAKAALITKLTQLGEQENAKAVASSRSSQVGSGMRGDKTFTIRFQDDRVTNHNNDRSMSVKQYMRGNMDELWS